MRKRDHDEVMAAQAAAYEAIIEGRDREIEFLRAQNVDLLNRCMAQDWTAYTAISATPQEELPLEERLYDETGLIDIPADE